MANGTNRNEDTKRVREETVPQTTEHMQLRVMDIIERKQFAELENINPAWVSKCNS